MADYYTALKRATENLDVRTVETRRTVYETVRSALIRQLKSIDPPLATVEISRERLQLEEAIRRVENEIAAEAESAQDSRDEHEAEPSSPEYEDDGPSRDTEARAPPEHYLKRRVPARSSGRQEDDDVENEAQLWESAAPRSRVWKILLFVFVVAIIASLGMLAWSQRAVIANLFSGADGGATDIAAPETQSTSEDRLADEPVADPNVRVVNALATPDVLSDPSVDKIAPEPPATSGPAVGGEGAVLYEEPANTAPTSYVTAIGAVDSWQFVEDGASGPEISAELEVPERQMTIHLVIRRNTDLTLPASHIVEAEIDTPPDFPSAGIQSVPRLVMKSSENDSGDPLIGAAATLSQGYFWIALSGAEANVDRNLQLLTERSRIDLLLVYETGQTAVLSFEKGPVGTEVFEKALAAWDSLSDLQFSTSTAD